MSNEEILNLWNCNILTCGEVVEVARADERVKVIEELSGNTIESIKKIQEWYVDVYKETDTNKVPIYTILYDLDKLIEQLKEHKK